MEKKKRIFPDYKEDHLVGMKVPNGGSSCAKCKHLVNKTQCDDKEFIDWNYGDPEIPAKDMNSYCCDFFKIKGSPLDKVKLK